ncbi:EamA family transporter [bacterium]|nr:MAG: EamA family transporter [bacterium]
MWIILALVSALVTGLSAVVSKIGLSKVDSSAAFAVQSIVILVLSWTYALATGKTKELVRLEIKDWGYLLLAGGVTTVAYLFYFGAIKAGDVSRVAPVDRLSLVFSIIFAAVFLSEKITTPVLVGGGLMVIGALIVAASGPTGAG